MIEFAALLLAAAAGFGIARAFSLPAIPFLILCGFGLSLLVHLEDAFLQDTLLLGITFLVFVAGIELNPQRVRRQKVAAVAVGTVQFVLLGTLGFGVARALGFDVQAAIYLALALTASSTLVVVRILQQRRQLFEAFGRLVIGVLLLQDLAVILLIPVVTRLPDGAGSVASGVVATLVLVALAFVLLRWVLPELLRRISLDEELLLLAVLALLFVFLFLSDVMGVPHVAGAFLAGLALSSFPVNGVVRGQLGSLSDFFTAMFFTALGATLGLPSGLEVAQAVVLALVVIMVTPPLVALIAERAGFSARPAIFSGLLLSQTSEFSLVVGLQGVVLEQIQPGTFTVIALVTLTTMTVTPFLANDRLSLTLMRFHPARRVPAEAGAPPENHVLVLGCGVSGMPLLETLVIGPYRVVAVDDDPQVVQRVRDAGVEAIRGDAADTALLRRAGADRARVVVSTVRRVEDNGPLLEMADGVPILVRVFNVEDAEWVEARGGQAVLYSDAAAEGFLEWFDRAGWARPDQLEDEEREQVL
ncbi:MAG: cation:proton antiporter [Gemmatimonadota bacterium]|nr:cation:proton antiporter [Gemmatimonadota bacterium]